MLVLGYYRVSFREKERPTMFHPPRAGFAGGRLLQGLSEISLPDTCEDRLGCDFLRSSLFPRSLQS